jgi:hypothetical protein
MDVAKDERRFVCVKECPSNSSSIIDCKSNLVQDCTAELYIYATKPLVTYCMPLDDAERVAGELVTDILNIAPLQSYFSDAYMAWELLLAMVGVSFGISVFYSVLIRFFAGCMVWTMIVILMVLLLGIGLVTALIPHL